VPHPRSVSLYSVWVLLCLVRFLATFDRSRAEQVMRVVGASKRVPGGKWCSSTLPFGAAEKLPGSARQK
jgi:hypothetical protein